MNRLKKLRIVEFLLIGVVMGVIEDLIAIAIATDAEINFNVIWVVLVVAIPFAYLSEVVVDHPKFWERIWPDKDKDGIPDALEKKA
jgi:hypothetical protein